MFRITVLKLMYWKRANPNSNRSSKAGTEDHMHQKHQLQDYQNNDRLSIYRIYCSENLN